MDSLLNFAKHETPKKSILQWIKESQQQKSDKFWEEHNNRMYFIRKTGGIYVQEPKDARYTDFGAIGYPSL